MPGTADPAQPPPGRSARSTALVGVAGVVLVYALVAGLWIVVSDSVVHALVGEQGNHALAQTAKGLAFVAVTALLLYALLRRLFARVVDAMRLENEAREQAARARGLLEAIAEGSTDAIFAKDAAGTYLLFNSGASRVTGRAAAEVVGRDDDAIFPPEQAALIRANDRRVMAEGRVITFEETLDSTAGKVTFLATKGPLRDEAGRTIGMFGVSRDISGLKRAEQRLRHANRSLRTLIEVNQALARADAEPELLRDICRLLVDVGGYRMAWVGYARDDEARTVQPVAGAGVDDGYLDTIRVSWADDEHGRGPTGTAIRERRAVVARDIPGDPGYATWRAAAVQRGYGSSAALPLTADDGRCLGALNLYAAATDAFDDDEIELLRELASDLSWGLRSLRDHEARRRAEGLLEAMSEIVSVGAWELDLRSEHLTLSPETYRIYGLAAETPVAAVDTVFALVHPDDRERLHEWVQRCRAGRAQDEVVFRIIRPDGEVRTVAGRGMLDSDPAGRPVRLVGTVQDITESRRAEIDALRWQHVFQVAHFGLAYHDTDGDSLVDVNEYYARQRGYTRDEMRGMPIAHAYAPEEREALQRRLAQADASGHVVFESVHLRKDGSRFPVLVEIASIRERGARTPSRIAYAIDIGERKAAEAALRESEDLYRSLFANNLDAVLLTTPEGGILAANPQAQHLFRSSEQRLRELGRAAVADLADPRVVAAVAERERTGRFTGELELLRADGSRFPAELSSLVFTGRDGRRLTSMIVRDLSERKAAEQELERHRHHLEELVRMRTAELAQARERAEAASRAKSLFLANMSHEIRTPMNAIVGLTHLLRRSGVTAEQALRLHKIDNAGRHLLAIISDILDLSKIEAGRMHIESTDFHLSGVLDNVASLVGAQAQARGLELAVDAGAVPTWLRGDPTRLRQALLNYASNAVKFTERGTVTLRARLQDECDGVLRVRFEVEDTGIGIAADKVETVFEAFEQADASTTRQYGGTGLGLAITRRLAELMDGEVGVRSEPGRGSLFWFTARLTRGHGPEPAMSAAGLGDAETRVRLRHAGARLLLAEDNAINREVALELLHGVGLAVDTAEDGQLAVAMARRHDYDLVLMDVQMPVMDGLAATRAIRALPGREHLPILAMTANAFEEDRRACEAAGMDDFVPKPVDPETLYGALSHWLAVGAAQGRIAAVPPPAVHDAARPLGEVLARLQTLPGLDVARGLAVVRGDAARYVELLWRVVDSHGDDARRLRELLAIGDPAGARAVAHNLKGVAGTMGTLRLAELATTIESRLRAGEPGDMTALLDELAGELALLAAAVPAVPAAAAAPLGAADAADLAGLLGELEQLLVHSDARALDLTGDNLHALAAAFGADAHHLVRLVNQFDFDAALDTLRKLRA